MNYGYQILYKNYDDRAFKSKTCGNLFSFLFYSTLAIFAYDIVDMSFRGVSHE